MPSIRQPAPRGNAGFTMNNPLADFGRRPAFPPHAVLAQRDKKINLNYPLPVSNDPNEPIRQKWINDTYQLPKSVLPPDAVDTPEELAQLSQYRHQYHRLPRPRRHDDPLGSTRTSCLGSIAATAYPTLTPELFQRQRQPLDQYGMEYNPVAINEVLAYSFQTRASPTVTATEYNRFFVELVNTLSQTAIGLLPAGDFGTGVTNPPDVSTLDLSLANYDMVMTADDPVSRPDPFTGQLLPIQAQLLRPASVQSSEFHHEFRCLTRRSPHLATCSSHLATRSGHPPIRPPRPTSRPATSTPSPTPPPR